MAAESSYLKRLGPQTPGKQASAPLMTPTTAAGSARRVRPRPCGLRCLPVPSSGRDLPRAVAASALSLSCLTHSLAGAGEALWGLREAALTTPLPSSPHPPARCSLPPRGRTLLWAVPACIFILPLWDSAANSSGRLAGGSFSNHSVPASVCLSLCLHLCLCVSLSHLCLSLSPFVPVSFCPSASVCLCLSASLAPL